MASGKSNDEEPTGEEKGAYKRWLEAGKPRPWVNEGVASTDGFDPVFSIVFYAIVLAAVYQAYLFGAWMHRMGLRLHGSAGAIGGQISGVSKTKEVGSVRVFVPTPRPTSTPTPTPAPRPTSTPTPTPAPRPTSTPTPGFTSTPIVRPGIQALGYCSVWRFSYYWPPLGGPNCRQPAPAGGCLSVMANGERWQDWVYRAVALSPDEYREWKGMYFVVERPIELRGVYLVADVCPACGKTNPPFVDFLMPVAPVPFGAEVQACIYPQEVIP